MRPIFAVAATLALVAGPAAAQQGLPVDAAKLIPHRDSLVVFVGGQPRGASVTELRQNGDTVVTTELTSIGTMMRQETTVTFDGRGQVQRVLQSGVVREFQASIDIQYVAGHVTGKVQAVDPAGKSVTLDNGTTLMIPATAKVDRKALAPGAEVKASYEEKGGQKVATSIQVAK